MGILLIPLIGIAAVAALVFASRSKPATNAPAGGPQPQPQPQPVAATPPNEALFENGADGVRRFRPAVAAALATALEQFSITPVSDDQMTVELAPRTSSSAPSARQWALALNQARSILAVHWILMPVARQYLRAVTEGQEGFYAQSRGGEYAVLASPRMMAATMAPPGLPSTTTPGVVPPIATTPPIPVPIPIPVPMPVILPPPGGTIPATFPGDGPPVVVAPPPQPPVTPPPIATPPITTTPPMGMPPFGNPPITIPPIVPGMPPVTIPPNVFPTIPPLGQPPVATTDVFSELPPELQIATRLLYQQGTDPGAMETVAGELAKGGFNASSAALRKRAKELRANKSIGDTIQGRTFTIQEGHVPYAVAQHYTGDRNRWRELPKSNPGMKIVTINGQTQLSPWRGGQVVTIPPDWDNTKGPPPTFSSAASAPRTKAKRTVNAKNAA